MSDFRMLSQEQLDDIRGNLRIYDNRVCERDVLSLLRHIAAIEAELAAAKAEVERLRACKQMFDHALDCVDLVFQKCSKNPNPILPEFCTAGESKFRAVVRLAKQHVKLLNDLRVVLAELCGVRRHVATILVDNGMPPASDNPENPS